MYRVQVFFNSHKKPDLKLVVVLLWAIYYMLCNSFIYIVLMRCSGKTVLPEMLSQFMKPLDKNVIYTNQSAQSMHSKA